MRLAGKRLLVVGADEDLARLLTAAAVGQGALVSVHRGGRDALARADQGGADAVVVELPLADMRGDVFLVAVRDRDLTCVAISGVLRGPRYAALARQFGAIAYLETPFRVEEAIGAIAAALEEAPEAQLDEETPHPGPAAPGEGDEGERAEKIATAPARGAAVPTSSEDATSAQAAAPTPAESAAPPAAPTATELPTPEATPTELAVTPGATELTAPAPSPAAPAEPTGEELLPDADSIIYSPARPALDDTLPGVPLAPPPAQGLELPLPSTTPAPIALRPGAPTLPAGSLATTTVPRLLAALYAAQVTGALALARGEVKKLVLFADGLPVLATSNVASERFGARCVREGVLSAAELAALSAELGPAASVGEALVARGRLDEGQRARWVEEQVRAVVWSTFGWRDGSYRLSAGPLPRRALVPVRLSPGDLVLEGHRRTGELERLRAELPAGLALAPRTDSAFQLYELALGEAEASLLEHADGTKTVRDLVLLSRLPEREALAFLQGCRDLGLVDEVSRVLAGTRRIGFM